MRFPLLFGAVLLALSSVPVYASECVLSVKDWSEAGKKFPDFEIIGGAGYDAEVADTSIIYIANGYVWIAAFKDGCFVAGPMALDTIVTAEPAPKPGALKSPKD